MELIQNISLRKRTRVTHACGPCRVARVKCDDIKPCSRCVSRNCVDQCVVPTQYGLKKEVCRGSSRSPSIETSGNRRSPVSEEEIPRPNSKSPEMPNHKNNYFPTTEVQHHHQAIAFDGIQSQYFDTWSMDRSSVEKLPQFSGEFSFHSTNQDIKDCNRRSSSSTGLSLLDLDILNQTKSFHVVLNFQFQQCLEQMSYRIEHIIEVNYDDTERGTISYLTDLLLRTNPYLIDLILILLKMLTKWATRIELLLNKGQQIPISLSTAFMDVRMNSIKYFDQLVAFSPKDAVNLMQRISEIHAESRNEELEGVSFDIRPEDPIFTSSDFLSFKTSYASPSQVLLNSLPLPAFTISLRERNSQMNVEFINLLGAPNKLAGDYLKQQDHFSIFVTKATAAILESYATGQRDISFPCRWKNSSGALLNLIHWIQVYHENGIPVEISVVCKALL